MKKSRPSSASNEGKPLQSETPVKSLIQVFHRLEKKVAVAKTTPSSEYTFQYSVGKVEHTSTHPEMFNMKATIST